MTENVLESSLSKPRVTPALQLGYAMRLQKIGLNPTLLAGLVLLALVALVAVCAPLLTPYDPMVQNLGEALKPPFSAGHVLGTDNFGRDVWSRIAYSTRLDLQIGLFSVVFPFVFGSLVGIATGYLGGRLDTFFMRIVDVLMAFPFLILVVAIMSILGPGLINLYIAFGFVGGIPYARIRASRNVGHAHAGLHSRRAHGRRYHATHHAPTHPAERHRARPGVRLHGHDRRWPPVPAAGMVDDGLTRPGVTGARRGPQPDRRRIGGSPLRPATDNCEIARRRRETLRSLRSG
jgi:hypothetical protein